MANLELNGSLVPIPDDTDIVVSYANHNLHELKNRNGAYSNTFKLHLSADLKDILENSHLTNSLTNIPYTNIAARLLKGNAVELDGIAILKETEGNQASILLLGNSTDWFTKLGDLSLQDMDLSALDHAWSLANVYARRDNAYTAGVVYPNIDYGLFTQREGYQVRFFELYPAVYCRYIFEKILTDLGYDVIGGFFGLPVCDIFNKMILPFSNQDFITPDYIASNSVIALLKNELNIGVPMTTPTSTSIPAGVYTNAGIDYHNGVVLFDLETQDQASQHNTTTGQLIIATAGTYNLTYTIYSTWASNSNDPISLISTLTIKKNGVSCASAVHTKIHNSTTTSSTTIIKAIYDGPLGTGDILTFELKSNLVTGFNGSTNTSYLNCIGSGYVLTPSYNVIGSPPLSIAANVPDIKQSDFLVAIANIFGLIFLTDPFTKTIRIDQLDYIKTSKHQPYDWTDKLDLTERPRRSFLFNSYGKINYFKYKADPNDPALVADPTFASGSFAVANATLSEKKDIYVSPFAALKRGTSFSSPWATSTPKTMASIPLWAIKDNIHLSYFDGNFAYYNGEFTQYVIQNSMYYKLIGNYTQSAPMAAPANFVAADWQLVAVADVFSKKKPEPRIAIRTMDNTNNITITGGSESTEPSIYFTDLLFQTLIDTNYTLLVDDILSKTKVVRALFKLNIADINRYQEVLVSEDGGLIPVWFVDENGEGDYYYINQIEQYNHSRIDSCWVELIRI